MRNILTRILLLAALAGPLCFASASAETADPELTAKLVQTAMAIQEREQEVLDGETRLDELKLRRRSQLASFDGQRGELSRLLSAMQRLGRQPPALMLVRSDAAIAHVRGATLLGAVVKNVEQEAALLREDLDEIGRLEAEMTEEHQSHVDRLAELRQEQEVLTELLVEQRGQQAALIEAASANAQAMAAIAKQAKDTGELLKRLEATDGAGDPVGAPRPRPAVAAAPAAEEENEEDYAFLAPEQPKQPAVAQPVRFSAAQGLLAMPARGKIVAKFGVKDSAGATRRGVSIRTRESAEVVAPFDGKVVFAGPFRAYGQLLILEAGEGYHILLSGMSQVHGVAGQNVTKGQPVGRMGTGPGSDKPAPAPGGGPDLRDLYVEFRKDGKPFDPMEWLKVSDTKVSG